MTILQDLNTMNPGIYWEGFIVDLTPCGVSSIFKFTNSSDADCSFGSYGTFIPFPIQGSGFEATTSQAPRPKLVISNVTKLIQPYILQYDDLIGAKITRLRTLSQYLDNGATPDDTQCMPIQTYFIEQKTQHSRDLVEFMLVTSLDLPFVKLPRAQVLKDQTNSHNLYAPGISRNRKR